MSEPQKQYVITLSDHISIQHDPKDTVLESLEKQNIDIHYHCREGFCGACRSKLLEGEVDYTTDPLAFIDDDEFLPCCTKPVGDIKIKIEQ